MKNLKNFNPSILFFVAVLISAFTTQAQNIHFPDIHLKTVLLANTLVNTNGDNEIQKSEADAFSGSLNVSNSTIYDMSGIEYFTNVTSLDCSNNDLEEIYLAENTGLMRINCNNNKLFELDLTNLTELMLLDCSTNSISNLNLNSNTALIRLNVNNNQLEGLDLSANLSLEKLDCSYNNITYLDLSANIVLESINCSSNNLSELNLANQNNMNISTGSIDATNNNLNCVQVDDQNYSNLYWSQKIDPSAYYSNNCTALPLKEITQDDFTFFPNPATDLVTVYFGGEFDRISVEVLNSTGVVVMKNTFQNLKQANIDLELIPGIYLLSVNTGSGNTITKKLIKK
jgi:hypothetical protein